MAQAGVILSLVVLLWLVVAMVMFGVCRVGAIGDAVEPESE
jgi:hypothetical protein